MAYHQLQGQQGSKKADHRQSDDGVWTTVLFFWRRSQRQEDGDLSSECPWAVQQLVSGRGTSPVAAPVQREACSGKQRHSELRVSYDCRKRQRSCHVVSTVLGRWKQAKAAPDPTVLCELLPSSSPSLYHSCSTSAEQWPSTGARGREHEAKNH